MAQNTGKPYEKLTKRVFEALLAQQSVTNVRVEHDIALPGITNEHQVDVYWEFETGGISSWLNNASPTPSANRSKKPTNA